MKWIKLFEEFNEPKQETSRAFFAACLQFCSKLQSSDYTFSLMQGRAESLRYFQAKRDGATPKPLSEQGKAAVAAIERMVLELPAERFSELAELGETAQVSTEII